MSMPVRFCVTSRSVRRRGGSVPRRRADDAELVRRTAAWLRAEPGAAREAGLPDDRDAGAAAALLDLLAVELPHVDPSVRQATVGWCRSARARA